MNSFRIKFMPNISNFLSCIFRNKHHVFTATLQSITKYLVQIISYILRGYKTPYFWPKLLLEAVRGLLSKHSSFQKNGLFNNCGEV